MTVHVVWAFSVRIPGLGLFTWGVELKNPYRRVAVVVSKKNIPRPGGSRLVDLEPPAAPVVSIRPLSTPFLTQSRFTFKYSNNESQKKTYLGLKTRRVASRALVYPKPSFVGRLT